MLKHYNEAMNVVREHFKRSSRVALDISHDDTKDVLFVEFTRTEKHEIALATQVEIFTSLFAEFHREFHINVLYEECIHDQKYVIEIHRTLVAV